MITFVHLSDIHFSPRDDLSQFDLDRQIRRALLEDLELKPAGGDDYDGLLVTGDIAFGGKADEYKKAQVWLDEVFGKTGISPAQTYMVPGNHDVDRAFVEPEFPLWDSHLRIRQAADPVVWRDLIAKQLQRDPLHGMLAPLNTYNDFAQGYDCRTLPDMLAWSRIFQGKTLDDGRSVRLHGLNSALVSDKGDAPGQLLVSEFQTSHFVHSPETVDVVLCHHPPEWLMDKASLRRALRTFVPLALFGHEHSTRVSADAKQVQLFAGAVQPSRRDPDWLPTYHIVQLSVVDGQSAELVVRIHTREFNKDNYRFRTRRTEDDQTVEVHRLALPKWTRSVAVTKIVESGRASEPSPAINEKPTVEPSMPTQSESAQRELLVHFFRLRTPDRYAAAAEAGLLRDGDDALQPQAMWAEVFRRATTEPNGLGKFWAAVATRTPDLRGTPNPFTG